MFKIGEKLYSAIYLWVEKTSLTEFHEEISKRVIGQPVLKDVCANVYSYLWCLLHDTIPNHNFILAAPSGSGKTETFRALRDYFAKAIPLLPVYSVDLSQITSAGFKGAEPSSILEPLARCGQAFPAAIVFMDEFDKALMPCYSGKGDTHKDLQANLLTLVEGGNISIESRPRNVTINTSNILFVGAGAFEEFREKRSSVPTPIGFGSDSGLTEDMPESHTPLTREDILKVGAMPELIGRFSFLYNYECLSQEAYHHIVRKVSADLCNAFHCHIIIDEDVVSGLVADSSGSVFGIRELEYTLRQRILQAWSEIQFNGVNLFDRDLCLRLHSDCYDYTLFEIPPDEEEETEEPIPEESNAFESIPLTEEELQALTDFFHNTASKKTTNDTRKAP
ncbi:MAG: AAA family ATPase [Lachnospiraceae bacterium]|nr:AAA family ATPase [Lachnospiraceae bacterium]